MNLEGIAKKDREDVETLVNHMMTATYCGCEGAFFKGGDINAISGRCPVNNRRIGFLLRKYTQEIALALGHSRGVYFKAGYQASGSGDFGRYSSARGHYSKASVQFF